MPRDLRASWLLPPKISPLLVLGASPLKRSPLPAFGAVPFKQRSPVLALGGFVFEIVAFVSQARWARCGTSDSRHLRRSGNTRSLRSGLFCHSLRSLCAPNMQALRSSCVPLAFPPAFPLPSPVPLLAFLLAFPEDQRSGNARSENK